MLHWLHFKKKYKKIGYLEFASKQYLQVLLCLFKLQSRCSSYRCGQCAWARAQPGRLSVLQPQSWVTADAAIYTGTFRTKKNRV